MQAYAHFYRMPLQHPASPPLPIHTHIHTHCLPPLLPSPAHCCSHTCQGASRESLIIATDGPPLWGLLVYVTSYVRGCYFMSPSVAGEGTPAVLLHVWLLATGREVQRSSVTVLLDVMIASWAASLHYALSEYDGDSFYGALHSLLACGWMTVFTAHKWSGMHIFWVIRRTVRRHTQREMHAT